MPPRTPEERARRRQLAEERKQARKAAKEKQAKEKADQPTDAKSTTVQPNAAAGLRTKTIVQDAEILKKLPDDPLHQIYTYLVASELGCLSMACRQWNTSIAKARVTYLLSRLCQPNTHREGMVGYTHICKDPNDAR